MIKSFILPNGYRNSRKAYKGEVYIFLGHESIELEHAFLGTYENTKDIIKAFSEFIERQEAKIRLRNPKFERFIFQFESSYAEEPDRFNVVGVRPETEKEIETRKKKGTNQKKAAQERKKQQEIRERNELERLKKKYDAV